MYRARIELATPGSAVRHASVARHVTDCGVKKKKKKKKKKALCKKQMMLMMMMMMIMKMILSRPEVILSRGQDLSDLSSKLPFPL